MTTNDVRAEVSEVRSSVVADGPPVGVTGLLLGCDSENGDDILNSLQLRISSQIHRSRSFGDIHCMAWRYSCTYRNTAAITGVSRTRTARSRPVWSLDDVSEFRFPAFIFIPDGIFVVVVSTTGHWSDRG